MSESNIPDVSKRLSPKSIRLLDELSELSIKGADLVPQLYSSLSEDGLQHKEILPLIEERLDIGRRRLYQLLAPEQKRSFTKTKVKKIALSNQINRRLVIPEEPTDIPPPPQPIVEVEPEREPPKAINEPISIPKTIEVLFDPAPIDRDRTQVFILQIDIIGKKVIKYRTAGRRAVAK